MGNSQEMTTAATKTEKSDPPETNPAGASPATPESDAETITQTVGETAPVMEAGVLSEQVAEADPEMDAGTVPGDAVDGSADAQAKESAWELHPSELSTDAQDPLVGCLVALTKIFDNPRSAESMTQGLPLEDNKLTPALFLRAAERAGLSSRIVRRKLSKIPDVVLPVVLLLKDRSACVLIRHMPGRQSEVILPETGLGAKTIPTDELLDIYNGYAIFVRPEFSFRRHDQTGGVKDTGSWFWGTLGMFSGTYGHVVIAAFMINTFTIATPLFIMNVYDRVVPNQAIETLWVLAIGVGTVIGFDFLLRTLRGYFVDNAGKRADVVLSSRIFAHVLNMQMAVRPTSAGAFANQLRDFEALRDFFTSATFTTLVDVPFLGLFLLVIWMVGGSVVIVPLVIIPFVIVAGLIVQFPLRRAIQKTTQETSQKHGVIVETIGALETVKSLGAEGKMQGEWERFVGSAARSGLRARAVSQFGIQIAASAQQLVIIGVVIMGVFRIGEGEMTIGALIACTILTGRTMAPLAVVAGLLSRLQQSMTALKNLNHIMSLPVERPLGKTFLSRTVGKGTIEFQDVTLSYPGSDIPALRNVSFRIEPGERVGILGPIGSGKTTVSKLLIGLYAPSEGAVLVDGTDLRQIDPADLRRAIGTIMQDVILFHGTVRENIAMGTPYADDEMIFRAASQAGVHEFISRHPHGYDLVVGERGQTLSGGQRQCIALARALLPDPPIVLLDEPTSMMDLASERQFANRLKQLLTGKTLILITHRPSLFHLVDRLIVLSQGRVIADGPRDEILNRAKQHRKARDEG
jgi:ATP-binding cassette subfamily C protein LapB